MKYRLPQLIGAVATIALVLVTVGHLNGQAQTREFETAWGEPDLQGIWNVELMVPMERPAGITSEFYTEEQVAELDRQRSGLSVFANHLRQEAGSEADVAGAYNAVYTSQRPTGRRTAMIVDPPDGKMPPNTEEAQQRAAAYREYQLALIKHTKVCEDSEPACGGGEYGPPSSRMLEDPPEYPSAGVAPINRANGPEDRGLSERCLYGNMPHINGNFTGVFRRIVQSPGAVTIFYDAEQGQGFTRNIPITTAPHLPSNIRQWWGDSRGHWEDDTLVVDVTNFTYKTDFLGSRETLHLIERWTRTGPETLEVTITIDDPTVWTRPWTVIQDFKMMSNEANRIYTEPRCHEGNFGMIGALAGARAVEKLHEEGSGPHPASLCIGGCGITTDGLDPLALQ